MNLTNQIPQNDPVDVPFDGAGVPGQGEPGGNGVLVSAQSDGEGPQRRKSAGIDLRHPLLEKVSAQVTHLAKSRT